MDDLDTLFKMQQQVFASTRAILDGLAFNPLRQRGRHGPAQTGLVNQELSDIFSLDNRRNSATSCFNFWQFRHGGVIPSTNLIPLLCHRAFCRAYQGTGFSG